MGKRGPLSKTDREVRDGTQATLSFGNKATGHATGASAAAERAALRAGARVRPLSTVVLAVCADTSSVQADAAHRQPGAAGAFRLQSTVQSNTPCSEPGCGAACGRAERIRALCSRRVSRGAQRKVALPALLITEHRQRPDQVRTSNIAVFHSV